MTPPIVIKFDHGLIMLTQADQTIRLDPADLTYKAATVSIKDYHPKLITLSFLAFINEIPETPPTDIVPSDDFLRRYIT